MRTGIFITARLGSTRLKKKHLLKINDKPILYYLLQRICYEFKNEISNSKILIIISTSDEKENRKFEEFTGDKIKIFYGSVNNIPLRHFQTANYYSLDNIVSIDGDDILCSLKGMRSVYNALINGKMYVKTIGLPLGMNSFGYSYNFLEYMIVNHKNDILETGWARIFDNDCLDKIRFKPFENDDKLRFTLDYKEDFDFFKSIFEITGNNYLSISDEYILQIVKENDLFKINESKIEEYLNNFKKSLNSEKNNS